MPQETPEAARRRLARLTGAVYLALGVSALLGYFHAPLVEGDLAALAGELTRSELRFNLGVVADVAAAALTVPLTP